MPWTYEPKLVKRLSTRRVRLARMILIQAIRNAVVNDLVVRNVAYRGHCAGPAVREQRNDRRRPNLTR